MSARDVPVGAGRERQSIIYRDGVSGRRPRVPTDADGLEARARRVMSRKAWAYVAGGAGAGRTTRDNRAAFTRWATVPRMATGHATRDTSLSLLGNRLGSPVLLAPVGAAGLVRRDSDLHIARAANATGVPYVVSNQGCKPMEQTAEAMGETPWWFQLY